jgi:hypothetical protein
MDECGRMYAERAVLTRAQCTRMRQKQRWMKAGWMGSWWWNYYNNGGGLNGGDSKHNNNGGDYNNGGEKHNNKGEDEDDVDSCGFSEASCGDTSDDVDSCPISVAPVGSVALTRPKIQLRGLSDLSDVKAVNPGNRNGADDRGGDSRHTNNGGDHNNGDYNNGGEYNNKGGDSRHNNSSGGDYNNGGEHNNNDGDPRHNNNGDNNGGDLRHNNNGDSGDYNNGGDLRHNNNSGDYNNGGVLIYQMKKYSFKRKKPRWIRPDADVVCDWRDPKDIIMSSLTKCWIRFPDIVETTGLVDCCARGTVSSLEAKGAIECKQDEAAGTPKSMHSMLIRCI